MLSTGDLVRIKPRSFLGKVTHGYPIGLIIWIDEVDPLDFLAAKVLSKGKIEWIGREFLEKL
jgi:hypothetical protein